MKYDLKSPFDINKIEFWGATILYVLSIFLLISEAGRQGMTGEWAPNAELYEKYHIGFSYFSNYLIPKLVRYTIFYCSYLALTLYLVPQLLKRKNLALNIILTVLLFLFLGIVFGITDTWLKGYMFGQYDTREEVYDIVFKSNFVYASWLLIMFGIYTSIKFWALYLLENSDRIQAKYQLITRDGIIAFIFWMIGFFILLIGDSDRNLLGFYVVIIPFSILLYWYSQSNLIPGVQGKRRSFIAYLLKVAVALLLTSLPCALLILLFINHGEAVAAILSSNAAFQLLITAPVSWFIYKKRQLVSSELVTLKTALDHSDANLNLLRSQINPHFLFNALNTLYGTALQENADRTGEGIQRLGDMMRFMLEENMQDKITLNREIEYINNYIALQKLRTQTSPDIIIQTAIDSHADGLSISPMLLIPFIENAFKHGISLREPSHIKVSLQITGQVLYFDVYNSIHAKDARDPEKENNGIGLSNVKQRLQLLYPNKQELIIRKNTNEFFVHLTIQLT